MLYFTARSTLSRYASLWLLLLLSLGLLGCARSDVRQIIVSGASCEHTNGAALTPLSSDLRHAPPNFVSVGGEHAIFVDFEQVDTEITLDAKRQMVTASAEVYFYQAQCGMPIIDLKAEQILSMHVDGKPYPKQRWQVINDPDNQSQFTVFAHRLPIGQHKLSIQYRLHDEDVSAMDDEGIFFFSFVDDWERRPYAEHYMPSNFLFDRYAINLKLSVINTDRQHSLYTNGKLSTLGLNAFQVIFPDRSNSAWPYVHLLDQALIEETKTTYSGLAGDIPVTVYSAEDHNVQRGLRIALSQLKLLESLYGPYPFDSLTIGLNDDVNMEYPGATLVEPDTIEHEMAHLWFGRGVFPRDGDAEWIDEAIAVWHDDGYPRARRVSVRNPKQLAGFSPYRRHLPPEAYEQGMAVLMALDRYFASRGGLRPILKEWLRANLEQPVTTQNFVAFINEKAPTPLDGFFKKYIYGGTSPPRR